MSMHRRSYDYKQIILWASIAAATVAAFVAIAIFTGGFSVVAAAIFGGIASIFVPVTGLAVANLTSSEPAAPKPWYERALDFVKNHKLGIFSVALGGMVALLPIPFAGRIGAAIGGAGVAVEQARKHKSINFAFLVAAIIAVFVLSGVAFIPGGVIGLVCALAAVIPLTLLAADQVDRMISARTNEQWLQKEEGEFNVVPSSEELGEQMHADFSKSALVVKAEGLQQQEYPVSAPRRFWNWLTGASRPASTTAAALPPSAPPLSVSQFEQEAVKPEPAASASQMAKSFMSNAVQPEAPESVQQMVDSVVVVSPENTTTTSSLTSSKFEQEAEVIGESQAPAPVVRQDLRNVRIMESHMQPTTATGPIHSPTTLPIQQQGPTGNGTPQAESNPLDESFVNVSSQSHTHQTPTVTTGQENLVGRNIDFFGSYTRRT